MHLHKTRWTRILCSWLIAIRKYQIPPFLYHAYFVISFVFIPAKRLTHTRTQSGHYVTPCFSSRRHTIMHVPAAWQLNLSFRFFGNFFYFSFCCSTQLAMEKIIISITLVINYEELRIGVLKIKKNVSVEPDLIAEANFGMHRLYCFFF